MCRPDRLSAADFALQSTPGLSCRSILTLLLLRTSLKNVFLDRVLEVGAPDTIVFLQTAGVVPQRSEYVVERLEKYRTTLEAGFHILIPFFDKVAYRPEPQGGTHR